MYLLSPNKSLLFICSFLHLFISSFLHFSVQAQIRTRQAGAWSDCDTWPRASSTPGPSDHVQLDHAVRLSNNQNVGQISLGSGGSLNLRGFDIGFGGASTANSCCISSHSTGMVASSGGVTLSEVSRTNVTRTAGNFANLSDGNTGTTFMFSRRDRNLVSRRYQLRVRMSFARGTYSNYTVTVRGSVICQTRDSSGLFERAIVGTCDAGIIDSGGDFDVLDDASSRDESVDTDNFTWTLTGSDLRSSTTSSIDVEFRGEPEDNDPDPALIRCEIRISEISVTADCP